MRTRAHRVLSRAEKVRLRHLVEDLERETGAEISALVVPHVDDLERFATSYFNHLGLGKRGHDNGILVLVVVDRRLVRIEVGRGLETTVTSAAAQRIITDVMTPHFRQGAYGEGLVRGVEALADLVRKAEPSASKPRVL
jgi:uncharacterized protein